MQQFLQSTSDVGTLVPEPAKNIHEKGRGKKGEGNMQAGGQGVSVPIARICQLTHVSSVYSIPMLALKPRRYKQ